MRYRALSAVSAALGLLAAPAFAQVRVAPAAPVFEEDEQQQPLRQLPPVSAPSNRAGRVAESTVGEVGQRQTQVSAGIKPTARIANRIQNRVQSRIRNRIDRTYDPQANATSPFATAEEQARGAGRAVR